MQIEDASRDSSRTKNYQIKSDAIVASRFAEVLYLDSDNMPCGYLGEADGRVNTTHMPDESYLLWNAPAYKRLGAMFWPDYWKTSPVNPIWAIIGTQCRDEWEQEAGQILIDKRRHMDALLLTNWFLDNWQVRSLLCCLPPLVRPSDTCTNMRSSGSRSRMVTRTSSALPSWRYV